MKMERRRELHDRLTELADEYEEILPSVSAVLHGLAGAVLLHTEHELAMHCAEFARSELERISRGDAVLAAAKATLADLAVN